MIDRTKGYFPVPAIRQLEGPYLDRVRAALTDPAAQRPRAVPPGPGRPAAGRPEHDADDPGLERAVAARAAGDVAAAPWHLARSCRVRDGARRPRTSVRSWCRRGAAGVPTLSPHAEQLAFLSDRNGSPQVFVSDLRMDGSVDRPQLITLRRRPGRVGQLVRRRRLAGLRGGHRRRRPHPGLGGPPRRSRRPADRRFGRPARRARAVDPQRSPGHGDHPRLRRATVARTASWPIRRPASCTRWPPVTCSACWTCRSTSTW